MTRTNDFNDVDIQKLLEKLAGNPARDPHSQAEGRANFIAQARALAMDVPREEERRHIRWNTNFFERNLKPMKLQTKLSILLAVIMAAVIAVYMAGNVTTVSAQQILTRASAAQTLPLHGIWHTRIHVYQNQSMLSGDHPGTTTINDDFLDTESGKYRFVSQDSTGKIMQANAFDGTYIYTGIRQGPGGDLLEVTRTKLDPQRDKKTGLTDSAASAKALFDTFKNNPRVRVAAQKTWSDGTPVYVLVDDNTQTQKGTNGSIFTGSMRMIFNADTYQLVESQTTVRKDDQDIVIDEAQWLVNEVLPEGNPVAWDLSDLKGITIVADSGKASAEQAPVKVETLTEQELATHTKAFYVLKPLPGGYSENIIAVVDQPKDQDYQFEINYSGPDGETFGLQAVGKMDPGFVASSFYDGSYKATSGLEIHYSPSHPNGGTSAMLIDPDGNGFLLISSLPREKVQELVETLVKGQ